MRLIIAGCLGAPRTRAAAACAPTRRAIRDRRTPTSRIQATTLGWDTTLEGIPCWEGNPAGWDVHGRWDTGCVRTNAARMIASTSRLSLPCHALPRWPAAPISATSAPGLGSRLPHPHQDRTHPARICAEAGLTTATSAPGLSSPCQLLCLAWQIPRSRAARPHCTQNKGMAAAAEGEPAHQCRLVGVAGRMPPVMLPGVVPAARCLGMARLASFCLRHTPHTWARERCMLSVRCCIIYMLHVAWLAHRRRH